MENYKTKSQSDRMQDIANIFVEHGDFFRSILSKKFSLQSGVDIEDLFQEFFISLVENSALPDIKCIKSYLYTAIINDIKDHYRKAKVRQKVKYEYKKYAPHFRSKDPSMQAEDNDMINHIRHVMDSHLPRHELDAINQTLSGNNLIEGAKNMGIKKRSFSHYLCTGVKRLKAFFSETENVF
jgi:RNA polymerase sigma factor (sigma-70 family)